MFNYDELLKTAPAQEQNSQNLSNEEYAASVISAIKSNLLAGKGFRDMQTKYEKYSQSANPEIKIKSLEQQLSYKDQEIEFLKKIVSLGKGASES